MIPGPRFYSGRLCIGLFPVAFAMLVGCATNSPTAENVAEGAAYGAAAGAAVGAVVPGVSVIEGAAVGAAIGGLHGAVWADRNNDGYVDGYVQNGQYYAGTPQGYDPTLRRVATGALGGAALGSAAGAVIPGLSVLEGAVAGAPVSGPGGPFWADADGDGRVDGYIYDGRYYAGRPPSAGPGSDPRAVFPPPPPSPPPPEPERGGYDFANIGNDVVLTSTHRHISAILRVSLSSLRRAAYSADGSARLGAVRTWQTTNGALTRSALIAILEQCVTSVGEVGSECLAAVRAGAGDFSAVPESARREFAATYRESCSVDTSEETCVERLQNATMFRTLPRGGLQLSPLKMDEGKRTLFTALVRDSGETEGRAGLSSDVGFEPDPARPGQERRISVVPYSPRMCFSLKADDPAKAKIEPQPGEGRTIEPPSRMCMTAVEGMSAIKYDPSWWVTPLGGDDLQLYLTIEHYVGSQKRNFPQEPWPIVIDVTPKPGYWDRLDAFLERATGTANLATGLATAIGALIAAIAAWGIWGWFKRKRSAGAAGGQ